MSSPTTWVLLSRSLDDIDWNREEFEQHGRARFHKAGVRFDPQGR
jgi:hypothetical protein